MLEIIKFSFFLVTLNFFVADSFDPSKIDYCSIKCKRKDAEYVSTACNCVPGNDRTYFTKDMQKFRQGVLDAHNERRNFIASGGERANHYDSAANMHILRYDLELEHLAKCYVMWQNFTSGHDNCRQTSYCKYTAPGQNIAGKGNPNKTSMEMVVHFIKDNWYGELTNIPTEEERRRVVKKFYLPPYHVGHFTQMVWATHERLGCARAQIPKNTFNYKFCLMCNYAGPDESCGGNIPSLPIYEIGEPCSKCGNTKCNKDLGGKYEALCGADEKVPSDEIKVPTVPPGEDEKTPSTELAPSDIIKVPTVSPGANKSKSRRIVNKIFIVPVVFVVINKVCP